VETDEFVNFLDASKTGRVISLPMRLLFCEASVVA